MRSGHRHLDRLACKARHGSKLVDESKVDRVRDRSTADSGWVKHVRVIAGDGLRLGLTLEGRNLLPKIVEHGVRRRVAIVPAPVHFTTSDDIDPGTLLFENGRLH